MVLVEAHVPKISLQENVLSDIIISNGNKEMITWGKQDIFCVVEFIFAFY